MLDLTPEQRFDALKLRYSDQTELNRFLTSFDFKVFSGFISLQLVIAGWYVTQYEKFNSLSDKTSFGIDIGLLTLDTILLLVALILLESNLARRISVVGTIKNINEALGFTKCGTYLADRAINAPHTFAPWARWYQLMVFLAYLSVILIVCLL